MLSEAVFKAEYTLYTIRPQCAERPWKLGFHESFISTINQSHWYIQILQNGNKKFKATKISFIEAVKSNEDDMKPGLKKPAKENQFWRAHSLNSPDPQLHQHTHLWEPKTEKTYFLGQWTANWRLRGQLVGLLGGSLGLSPSPWQPEAKAQPDLLHPQSWSFILNLNLRIVVTLATGSSSFPQQGGDRVSAVCTRETREAAASWFTGTLSTSRGRWVDENAQHGNKSKISWVDKLLS